MSVSVASFTTNTDPSSASFTITKPTGLAVGDLLVFCASRATNTLYSLAGWTSLTSVTPDSTSDAKQVLYKTAAAGDVAAANFTFTATGVDSESSGVLYRITSSTSAALSIVDFATDGVGDTATPTYILEVEPFSTNALLIGVIGLNDNRRVSGYTLSPDNPTWVEDADLGVNSNGIATISANPTTVTTTTQLTATIALSTRTAAILLVIAEQNNATGTNNLLTTTSTFFDESAVEVGGSGTSDLLTASGTIFDANGRVVTVKTVDWTNETKDSGNWTDQIK